MAKQRADTIQQERRLYQGFVSPLNEITKPGNNANCNANRKCYKN